MVRFDASLIFMPSSHSSFVLIPSASVLLLRVRFNGMVPPTSVTIDGRPTTSFSYDANLMAIVVDLGTVDIAKSTVVTVILDGGVTSSNQLVDGMRGLFVRLETVKDMLDRHFRQCLFTSTGAKIPTTGAVHKQSKSVKLQSGSCVAGLTTEDYPTLLSANGRVTRLNAHPTAGMAQSMLGDMQQQIQQALDEIKGCRLESQSKQQISALLQSLWE